jgi:ATP-dependent protease HslVU (ClpYQ) peptidase subunit
MTTIAYRDGVLAGDTQVIDGKDLVVGHQRKVRKLDDGSLFGYAGDVEGSEVLLRSFNSKQLSGPPECRDLNALIITPRGKVYLYEGRIWVKQAPGYYALGTGSAVALAAMDAGATAEQAVKIGINRDTGSGGKVQAVRLKGKK